MAGAGVHSAVGVRAVLKSAAEGKGSNRIVMSTIYILAGGYLSDGGIQILNRG